MLQLAAPHAGEFSPKSEIRMTKSERNPNAQIRNLEARLLGSDGSLIISVKTHCRLIKDSPFGFRAAFGFRHSDFRFHKRVATILEIAP